MVKDIRGAAAVTRDVSETEPEHWLLRVLSGLQVPNTPDVKGVKNALVELGRTNVSLLHHKTLAHAWIPPIDKNEILDVIAKIVDSQQHVDIAGFALQNPESTARLLRYRLVSDDLCAAQAQAALQAGKWTQAKQKIECANNFSDTEYIRTLGYIRKAFSESTFTVTDLEKVADEYKLRSSQYGFAQAFMSKNEKETAKAIFTDIFDSKIPKQSILSKWKTIKKEEGR